MRDFLERMKYSFQRFMYGRYGLDSLGETITAVGLAVWFIAVLARWRFMRTVGCLLILYALWRCYSRQIERRRHENQVFLQMLEKPRREYVLLKQKHRDRKTHRYFKCVRCKTVLRVPKGRGKIQITCPKCGESFIKKT